MARRIIKFGLILLGVILALLLVFYFSLPTILGKYGITYHSYDYDMPSSLSLTGFQYNTEGLEMKADRLHIQWSWSHLFEGKISGRYLRLHGAQLTYVSTPAMETDSDTTDASWPIQFDEIHLTDSRMIYESPSDTGDLYFADLLIKELDIDETYQVDSIINTGSQMVWTSRPSEDTLLSNPFSPQDIPVFSIGSIWLVDNAYEVNVGTEKYQLNDVNLTMHTLHQNDLLNANIEHLSLLYQDTLQIVFSGEQLQMNDQKDVDLKDLALQLPGLDLNLNRLDLQQQDNITVEWDLASSSLDSRLARILMPDLQLPFEPGEVHIEGTGSYENGQLSLHGLQLDLPELISAQISGTAAVGQSEEILDLQISHLHTTLYKMAKAFAFQLPQGQNDVNIDSELEISGSLSTPSLAGTIIANRIPFDVVVNTDLSDSLSTRVTAQLTNPSLRPYDLSSLADSTLFVMGSWVHATATLDSENNLYSYKVDLSTDTLSMSGYQVHSIQVRSESGIDSTWTTCFLKYGELNLNIASSADLITDQLIEYTGSIDGKIPESSDDLYTPGDLAFPFNGVLSFDSTGMSMSIFSDSLYFQPFGYSSEYRTTLALETEYRNSGDLALNINLGANNYVQFESNDELVDWISSDNPWEGPIPYIQLEGRLQVDSTFLLQTFHYPIAAGIDQLQVETQSENIMLSIDLPYFTWDNYYVNNVEAVISGTTDNLTGEVTVDSLKNPYTMLQGMKAEITELRDGASTVSIYTNLPEIGYPVDVSFALEHDTAGQHISITDTQKLQFGSEIWAVEEGNLYISSDLDDIDGALTFTNEAQKISLSTSAGMINWSVDSLDLSTLARIFMDDSTYQARLSIEGDYETSSDIWITTGVISDVVVDTFQIGSIDIAGHGDTSKIVLDGNMVREEGSLDLSLRTENEDWIFNLDLVHFDLTKLEKLVPGWPQSLAVTGLTSGKLTGMVADDLRTDGYFVFEDSEIRYQDYGIFTRVVDDTVYFENYDILFRNNELLDRSGQKILLDGTINLENGINYNVTAKTDRFRLLDNSGDDINPNGLIEIESNLQMRGPSSNLEITGFLNTLPGGHLNWKYESDVSLTDRNEVVLFTDFDTLGLTRQDQLMALARSNPIKWNVDLDIADTDLYILIYETSNDFVRMVAGGSLELRESGTTMPNLYGALTSNEGSAFYDAPMVSDLNLKIEEARIEWMGEFDNPQLSFRGTEVFRISPADVGSGGGSRGERVPVTVVAILDEATVDNIDVHFDIQTNNSDLAAQIAALPQDSREQSAMNLLLFGSLTPDVSAGGTGLTTALVNKLNEISRRNVRNADLTFYVDENADPDDANPVQSVSKMGYSFSKGLFDRRFRFTIGGDVNLGGEGPVGARKFNPFGNLELDYFLRRDPEVSLFLARNSVYKGAFDGQVNESSAGIGYKKTFPNLFQFHTKEESK